MPGKRDIEAGRAFVRLFLRNDLKKQLTGALGRMQKSLKSAGESMTRVGGKMLRVGLVASAGFAGAVKLASDFDDQMRIVKAVTQASAEQFERLRATALELGRTTSFTASEVAALMTELGRAGFDTDQIERMTASVLDLAKATGSDATLASGVMAAAIRQFSMEAGDASRVADALTVAANKSFNTLESLGESLTYAGPVASMFNMSIEDTLALLGALGNVGIQGSNAGTALRRLLTLTGAEAKKLKTIFGVEFTDAAGNARPLVDVLDEVNEATKNLGTAERAKKFNDAFGLLGITGASAISKNITSVKELREALANANGVAAKTHQEMESGLGGSLRRLWSAAEGVAIAIGDALAPAVQGMAAWFSEAAGKVTEFVHNNRGLIVAIAAGTIAFTAAGAALVALGTGAVIASTVVGGLATIFGALLSPLGLAAAAIATGAVLWAKYTESGQMAMAALGRIFETAKKTLGGIADAMMSGDIARAGDIAFTGLRLIALQALNAISGVFGETVASIVGDLASGNLESAWETATQQIGILWDSLMSGVLQAMADAARGIRDIWHSTLQSVGKAYLQSQVLLGKLTKEQASAAEIGIDIAFGVLKARGDNVNTPLTSVAKRLEAESQAAARRRDQNQKRLDERNRGTGRGRSKEEEVLKRRLDRLTAGASSGTAGSSSEAGGASAAGAGGSTAPAASLGGGVGGALPVTFNAAAAIAGGFQGTKPPTEKKLDDITKNTAKTAEETKRHADAMDEFVRAFRFG